jgi:hypothetical protein
VTAAATYGVTPAVVAARIHGLRLSETSRPTEDEVEEFIESGAAELDGLLRSLGVRPDSFSATSTMNGYRIAKQWLTLFAAVETVRANERDATPMLVSLQSSLEAATDRITKRPAMFTEGQPETPDANVAASHVTAASPSPFNVEPLGLGARMARSGQL